MSVKIGRNDPCPCGSGKKYKKCCLEKLMTCVHPGCSVVLPKYSRINPEVGIPCGAIYHFDKSTGEEWAMCPTHAAKWAEENGIDMLADMVPEFNGYDEEDDPTDEVGIGDVGDGLST